jgi:hypothetical protein
MRTSCILTNYAPIARVLIIVVAFALSACKDDTISVNLHGVNYSGTSFSFYVADFSNPEVIAGGERIARFSGGGITCCAVLPKTWRPGIKLKIHTTHRLPQLPNGIWPEIDEDHLVELPPYVAGNPGELWVLRNSDGKISVVSSDFQPDHPKWPGKIKGWPEPTFEYKLEMWGKAKEQAQENVDLYLSLILKLKQAPRDRATESWNHAVKYDPDSLLKFSGPYDPKYIEELHTTYTEELAYSRQRLEKVMELKP